MKKKTNLVQGILVVFLLISVYSLYGQPDRHHRGGPHLFKVLEQLKGELNLSEDQINQLDELKVELEAKKSALQSEVIEDLEDRKTAIKSLMQYTKNRIDGILTTEQIALLQAKKDEHKKRLDSIDREGLKEALSNYHDENIKPIMLAQRTKLEDEITLEDKETLDELRSILGDLEPKHRRMHLKEKRNKKEEKIGEKLPEISEEKKAALTTLKPLVEKYSSSIKALLQEIEPQHQQWREDMKKIAKSFLGDHPKGEKEDSGSRRPAAKQKKRRRAMVKFLLLSPEALEINEPIEANPISMNIYPNPSTSVRTLNYEVEKPGNLRIELRRDDGTLVEILVNDDHISGKYNMDINTQNLNEGSYYITIIDNNGKVSSQKMIVSK